MTDAQTLKHYTAQVGRIPERQIDLFVNLTQGASLLSGLTQWPFSQPVELLTSVVTVMLFFFLFFLHHAGCDEHVELCPIALLSL